MGKKKSAYQVYRDDDSDDANDVEVPQSRTIVMSKNRRTVVEIPASPQKRARPNRSLNETLLGDGWEPGAYFELDERELTVEGDDINVTEKLAAKRYPTSDAPLREWYGYANQIGYREEYLHEWLRHEGRGEYQHTTSCPTCNIDSPSSSPLYRCKECTGGLMECMGCCLERHRRLPLHSIQRWNGSFFDKTTLQSMGLRVQLGHADNYCVNPKPGHKDFLVLHVNGIHHISVDFCDCDKRVTHWQQLIRHNWFPATVYYPQTCCTDQLLDFFHILTLSSKLCGHDFYHALERLTDNLGLNVPKSRYVGLMRMIRQYRHLKLLKRAGCGNLENGVGSLKRGDLAILCPACPIPDINLPNGWDEVDDSLKFLYALIVAIDANFRLKNRIRSTEAADPGLHTGFAYLVENGPYLEHVKKYASQKDMSTCSGFKTLAHTETKFSTGLRSTGVGMCNCACHEIVRLAGVGTLQKGERYCNMDYIFLSAVLPLLVTYLVATYDISCQWIQNFKSRMKAFPPDMYLPDHVTLDVGVPKFHAPGHQPSCQSIYSLNVKPGVGRTDGEGIERNWSELNPIASSIKEMGPGSFRDTLDDHIHFHNFRKYISLGKTLRTRLLLAVPEWNRHQRAHEEFTRTLPNASLQLQWTKMICTWERDKSKPNPYYTEKTVPTEAEVRLRLQEDERRAVVEGGVKIHETSATSFLALGLSLEESQRRIHVITKHEALTVGQAADLQNKRISLQKRLDSFRKLQTVYMPGAGMKISEREAGHDKHDVEDVLLCLPSQLEAGFREQACYKGLAFMEEQLRESQCQDSLDNIRNLQRAKMHFIHFRNSNTRGQKNATRAHTLIDGITDKIQLAARRYRDARIALLALRGPGEWEKDLRVLSDDDIRSPNSSKFDIENPDDMIGPDGRLKTKKQRLEIERRRQLGEGHRTLSWIWFNAFGTDASGGGELNEVLRVEWAKSRARALRWYEEVLLLKEEMRRVRRFLEWKAAWWQARAGGWRGLEAATAEGIKAYALRQMSFQQALSMNFTQLWTEPLKLSEGDGDGMDSVSGDQALNMISEVVAHPSDEEEEEE